MLLTMAAADLLLSLRAYNPIHTRKDDDILEKLYTVAEASQILRLHYQSVYKLLRSGELKAVRPGRKWLIPESEIQKFLDSHKD